MRIFEYLFMQRAFVVGILLAAVVPCVGMVVVCQRLSMIGDEMCIRDSLRTVPPSGRMHSSFWTASMAAGAMASRIKL